MHVLPFLLRLMIPNPLSRCHRESSHHMWLGVLVRSSGVCCRPRRETLRESHGPVHRRRSSRAGSSFSPALQAAMRPRRLQNNEYTMWPRRYLCCHRKKRSSVQQGFTSPVVRPACTESEDLISARPHAIAITASSTDRDGILSLLHFDGKSISSTVTTSDSTTE